MDSTRPENRLLIGEAARLLGITPKAIRHYEKLGMIEAPERSGSGYRLYAADSLLRLNRIKKLQRLGLSLGRIKALPGEGDSGLGLEDVLETLLGEVEEQIEQLQRRRVDLRRMLPDGTSAGSEDSPPEEEPHALAVFRERMGDRLGGLDPRMLEQMRELWGTLDDFEWPRGYLEFQEGLARYMGDHPEECERLLALEERLAALAYLPEDSDEIELLAEDYAAFFAQSTLSEEIFGPGRGAKAPPIGGMGKIFSGVVLDAMYPAQRRCMELFLERFSPEDT
ncbi:MerR family transcriptional regulator [Rubrobacter aplysinae]|uniref:MerR family transcriptional regulator n=1 Tax=Rubrobacter aplysinae TaxID=909625 RepID=UPI00064B9294|nr:MerR family transcriptional regulator [Rubrobacter aplysinae]